MRSEEVRRKFIAFYKARGHIEIPSAPLVPENDPTTLFNSSGMQPLVPYLLGQPHPAGKRLVNSQKAIRLGDIEEVGDNRHTTFFEMLGNWSLGDPARNASHSDAGGYFKKEQLSWIFEFLTKELGLDAKKLYVSVFSGLDGIPKDTESIEIWKQLGIPESRIFTYPASKNWWSRSGEPDKMPAGEPGGPDSEVFFDFGKQLKLHENSPYKNESCHPNCDCGRFMEIANSVFMQYQKQADGSLAELSQKNVDFGGGLERLVAATENSPDVFKTDMFSSIVRTIELLISKKYGTSEEVTRAMRIIADHMRAAVMLIADGVLPSNKTQGYILRRLIRRAVLYMRNLGLSGLEGHVKDFVLPVANLYKDSYPEVSDKAAEIGLILEEESMRFGKSLARGLTELEKISKLDGKIAFTLYESYGFPWEMTEEIARLRGQTINREQFEEEFTKHKELSRTAAAGMFKGGLADHSKETTKLHTATHLLHKALRMVLGDHVSQKGSNITAERLRFDFSHPAKMSPEEIKKVEDLVNEKIAENLPVSFEMMDKGKALKSGALAFFGERYGEKVKVYSVGTYSREICGGPHVSFTGTLGRFTITKEESLGAGVRRIYATLI